MHSLYRRGSPLVYRAEEDCYLLMLPVEDLRALIAKYWYEKHLLEGRAAKENRACNRIKEKLKMRYLSGNQIVLLQIKSEIVLERS